MCGLSYTVQLYLARRFQARPLRRLTSGVTLPILLFVNDTTDIRERLKLVVPFAYRRNVNHICSYARGAYEDDFRLFDLPR